MREAMTKLEKGDRRQVYNLTLALFPLEKVKVSIDSLSVFRYETTTIFQGEDREVHMAHQSDEGILARSDGKGFLWHNRRRNARY